jgi:hypothetical protein
MTVASGPGPEARDYDPAMGLEYGRTTSGVAVARLAATGQPNWCVPATEAPAVAVVVDGAPLALRQTEVAPGVFEDITSSVTNSGLQIQWRLRRYPELAIVESRVVVRNATETPVTVDRLDSIVLRLDSADCVMRSFTSGWGAEFEGGCEPVVGAYRLESLSGRSSQGRHPYFMVQRPEGSALVGNIAWSATGWRGSTRSPRAATRSASACTMRGSARRSGRDSRYAN